MNERYHSLDTNNKLIWNFRDIGHILRHNYEGKGSQKRVLMILKEVTSITQRDLTERLGIQPGSASEVIGKLGMDRISQMYPETVFEKMWRSYCRIRFCSLIRFSII